MADSFGVSQVVDYLTRMSLRISNVDAEREIVELAFHGNHGQWRLIVGFQQRGEVRKLMLIAPHIATLTSKKRLECLEALLAVNYRIAMGKFGLDLDDGEIRLEEAFPLSDGIISFEQFQLAIGAIMQTVAIYHSLLPRIIYGNLSVLDALKACEDEFHHEMEIPDDDTGGEVASTEEPPTVDPEPHEFPPELDVNDVLAEITRMLEDRPDA
jgi:hypothetical protein